MGDGSKAWPPMKRINVGHDVCTINTKQYTLEIYLGKAASKMGERRSSTPFLPPPPPKDFSLNM